MSVRPPAPRLHVAPRSERTYGDLAAALATDYGLAPDEWQRLILDDWLAEQGQQWAALTCGLSVPRQNGKNAVLEMRELFGMIGRGEKIVHTAHQVKTAQKHFRRLKHFFGKRVGDPTATYPELNARVAELRNVNGQESITLHNGGSVEIVARSAGASGRGFTADVVAFDEAQDLTDDDQEALLSTTSAGPLGNTQWIFTGTPPTPKASGEAFRRIRDEALSGDPGRLCWHEWSCAEGVDLDDPETWAEANPALGVRVLLDVVEGERRRFSDGGFKRERLGMWTPKASTQAVIPADIWQALVDAGPPDGTRPAALGVDASHDRVLVIAACWPTEEGAHVELVALDHVADTLQAAEWLKARTKGRPRIPVVIDGYSPAASMIPILRAARVPVVQTNGTDMARACGQFYDDTMAGLLTHGTADAGDPTGAASQPQLDAALAGARRRPIGEAGGWGWDRKDPAINISPLVAATLARFGAATRKRKTPSTTGKVAVL